MSDISIDPKSVFPILNKKVGNRPLTLLDSSIGAPIPGTTIESVSQLLSYSLHDNLPSAKEALPTLAQFYEKAREKARDFINAKSSDEIYFSQNSTFASNNLAEQIARTLSAGNEILITPHNYSSTYGPWQDMAKKYGLKLRHPMHQQNIMMDMEEYKSMLSTRVKVVCLNALSTYTGLTLDIKECTRLAHEVGAIVIVDGAFACAHMKIDVQDLDCDFFYLSGYKLYSFSGVACVYGKKEHLVNLHPVALGTITKEYSTEHIIPPAIPFKHEPGTPPHVAAYSLGCGFDFINKLGGMDAIRRHESMLHSYLSSSLRGIPGVNILDYSGDRTAIASFTMSGCSHEKVQQYLDNKGILISFKGAGKAPNELFKSQNISSYLRSSIAIHNTKEDIDRLVDGIYEAKKAFSASKYKTINIETDPSGKIDLVKLDSPRLSDRHIGTKETGFRPYRLRGPNLDASTRGKQFIFNNYGHGATGWTLGPSTTYEVVENVKTHFLNHNLQKDEPIAVVGAGIIGLLSASMLVNEGFSNIQIVAKDAVNTTSNGASGHFTPELYALNLEYIPEEKIREWIKFAYGFWEKAQQQRHPFINKGVRKIQKFIYSEEGTIDQNAITNEVFKPEKVLVDFGSIRREMHVTNNYLAYETRDVMAALNEYLQNRVQLRIHEISDFKELEENIVINCAGLGNIELMNDGEMQSVLGHHIYLKNQQSLNLDYVISGTFGSDQSSGIEFLAKRDPNPTSAYDMGLLGTTHVYDTTSPIGHEKEFDNILRRMRAFFNTY